jgi:ThiF family
MNRLAILEDTFEALKNLIGESGPIEDGTFTLLQHGKGLSGTRFLAMEMMPLWPDTWEHRAKDILRPSARWISAAISRAIEAHAGLMFVHSHPNPNFPQGLSFADKIAFESLAQTLAPVLDGPFAATVVHPHGWSGVFWSEGQIIPIDQVVSVGRTLSFLSPIQNVEDSKLDLRQHDALGLVHSLVRNLNVGVVGCGGIGSAVAEQIVRMGVKSLLLIDHDQLDTDSNLRRMIGSTMADIRATLPLPKVDILGRHLEQLGLGVQIHRINGDVRTEKVFRSLLDVDLVLNCTDTHGSRAVVNDLASTYLLPVIDVGVRVSSKVDNKLAGLIAESRILTPTAPCLWCRKTIDGNVIRVENLPANEQEQLKREGYVVQGFGDPVPSVVALTVLGSSLVTCAMLRLLSKEGEVAPYGYWVDGFLGDSGDTGPESPMDGCRCRGNLGRGDSAPPPFLKANRL